MNPEQLLYAKTHEWIEVVTDPSGENVATLGISSFALEALADLVFLSLPEAGSRVAAGEAVGEIESVKAVSDLVSPVDGEVVEVNTALLDNVSQLSDDPYEAGWLLKIKVTDLSGLSGLLDYAAYQKQCEEEMAGG